MQAIQLKILGQVQGVGYRKWFEKQALELGLKGYVTNLADGAVEAQITGIESHVAEMIARAWKGPQRASVVDIQQCVLDHSDSRYLDFQIQT